ncbi:heparan-alpha-glucosaminide N-acetyltransferase domain-containing protein [Corynebacterium glyciniphilum]|uniref:heparan-alpha-glucosaminide N-acetyltransferase domain-containing protein n=1 Tax=Corynebacterium glyciniphilum TaxID=1404244 RepID=UPI003FCF75F6
MRKHDNQGFAGSAERHLVSLEPPARMPGVDLARGLAVFGMFAAHLLVTADLRWSEPGTWSGIVDGRSSVLFATLAGLSLGMTTGTSGHTDDPRLSLRRRRLRVRAALLWGLGILITLTWVPVNVILPAYGALFVLGAMLLTLHPRTLFLIAAVLAVVMPFVVGAINQVWAGSGPEEPDRLSILLGWHFPFPLWTAFLAAGLGTGKILGSTTADNRQAWQLLAAGTALAVAGYVVIGPIGNYFMEQRAGAGETDLPVWLLSNLQDRPHSSGVGETVGSGGFTLAVIAVCVLLGSTGFRHIVWPIRVVGSMPLTAYTAHLLIWAAWMFGEDRTVTGTDAMDGFRALDPFWPMVLCVTGGCVLWLLLFGKGPLERLLTRVSVAVVPQSGSHSRLP